MRNCILATSGFYINLSLSLPLHALIIVIMIVVVIMIVIVRIWKDIYFYDEDLGSFGSNAVVAKIQPCQGPESRRGFSLGGL